MRQGCPLAPLLYLFVAQALLSWLRQQGLGIRLLPARSKLTTASQYADDTEAVLSSLAELPRFVEAMNRFARASGQWLNVEKVELLQVGVPPLALPAAEGGGLAPPTQQPAAAPAHPLPPPPPQLQHHPAAVAGMRVVQVATALNLPVSNSEVPPQLDWDKLLAPAWRRMQLIARLAGSAFLRASTVSSYCLQTVTWHMEHGGPPAKSCMAKLASKAARLVDRRLGPEDRDQRLTGVPAALLPGPPRTGGFGLLPLCEHVQARNAVWAAQLALYSIAAPDAPMHPWIPTMAGILQAQHPALGLWSVLTARPEKKRWMGTKEMPEEILRLAGALGHLPPPVDVGRGDLELGPWCAAAPLWGNPAFPNATPASPPGLEHHHQHLTTCGRLLLLGDLVRALDRAPQGRARRQEWAAWLAEHVAPPCPPPSQLATPTQTLAEMRKLAADISPAWQMAARSALVAAGGEGNQAPSPVDAMGHIITRLGWRIPGTDHTVTLRKLTVRVATQLQLRAAQQRREELIADYVREAREGGPGSTATQLAERQAAFMCGQQRRWSKIRWEAEHKETLWRLAVDGVPLPGNKHLSRMPREVCGCGGYGNAAGEQCSPRAHHFWSCPVAWAVRRQMEGHLGTPLAKHHVWLVEPPTGCQPGPWDVVAMAALEAMERGRLALRTATGGGRVQQQQQQQQPPPQAVEQACLTAVARFWSTLQAFAALGVPECGWGDVGPSHPILWVAEGRVGCAEPLALGQELVVAGDPEAAEHILPPPQEAAATLEA